MNKEIQHIQPFTLHSQADIKGILDRLPADSEVISITPKESSLNSEGQIFVHSYDIWIAIKKQKDETNTTEIEKTNTARPVL